MELSRARELLAALRRSILATTRADGRPQLSPVTHVVDDEGRLVISSRETAYKVRNLRRDARVSLIAINDNFFGEWVQADGTAEIISLPDAMDLLVDYYRRAAGEHSDWDDYRTAMTAEQRCVIRIAIERAGPDRSG